MPLVSGWLSLELDFETADPVAGRHASRSELRISLITHCLRIHIVPGRRYFLSFRPRAALP